MKIKIAKTIISKEAWWAVIVIIKAGAQYNIKPNKIRSAYGIPTLLSQVLSGKI